MESIWQTMHYLSRQGKEHRHLFIMIIVIIAACNINDQSIGVSASVTGRDNIFTAYDCTRPTVVEDRALNIETLSCRSDKHSRAMDKDEMFQLLVSEPVETADGFRCEILESRQVSYCGNYDHQTLLAKFDYFDVPKPPTLEQCQRMWDKRKFKLEDGNDVDLEIGTTVANFQRVGRTWASGTSEVECQGSNFREGAFEMSDVIVDISLKIKIFQEKVRQSAGKTVAQSDGLGLPCDIHKDVCITGEATVMWTADWEFCPLAHSKDVKGVVVTDTAGDKVFMSTDGSLVRLVLQYQESHCNRMVWATNYPNLFLAPLPHSKPFTRAVDPTAMSISTYVNNRDDYLYSYLVDQIDKELSSVLQHDCEQRIKRTKQDYFLKHAHPGIITYTLGNGTFATAAGEVLYFYQCLRVKVKALEESLCYSDLPVQRLPGEVQRGQVIGQDRVKRDLGKNGTAMGKMEFMEPHTRRLLSFSVEVPCVKTFPSKYRLSAGKWITVDPHVRQAPMPRPMDAPVEIVASLMRELDMSHGGIYDAEALEQMEVFFGMPLLKEAMMTRLSKQIQQGSYHGPIRPGDMFHQDVPHGWFGGFAADFLAFLTTFGDSAAILTALYVIGKAVVAIVRWVYTGKLLYNLSGCGVNLLWALCPSLYLMRNNPADHMAADSQASDDRANVRRRPRSTGLRMAPLRHSTISTQPLTEEEEMTQLRTAATGTDTAISSTGIYNPPR